MRDTAVATTTMPPVHPSRWIGRGLRGRTTAPSDRRPKARRRHRQRRGWRGNDDRQGFGFGAKGDSGQRHVDDRSPPADRLRRAAADRCPTARPRACRLGTRWRHLPAGERLGARIAGIDAPETHAGQARCGAEIALVRAATARARMLLDGRNVTIMRVGRSYNRTVARVTLAGRDVGSELVAIGVARWQRKPDRCARARR